MGSISKPPQGAKSRLRMQIPSSSPADLLLSLLSGVRQTGPGKWMARCPSHEDRSPSLSIRETDDGTVLINCFGGCGVVDVVTAVGLDLADLFPRRDPDPLNPSRRPEKPRYNARELIGLAVTEGLICSVACRDMRAGKVLSDEDAHRVGIAEETLLRIYSEVRP
jgi:hypothetical protein